MFALRNLATLDKRPAALRERVFQKLFRIAEIAQMEPIERQAYHASQKNYWDMYSIVKTAQDAVAEEKDAAIEKQKAIIKEKDAALEEQKAIIKDKDAALTTALAELAALKAMKRNTKK
jgi:hypothetical protein